MADETVEAYNKIAVRFDEAHKVSDWTEELEYFARIISGKKILEIGCGTGRDAKFLVEKGFDYLGTDASSSMLKIAKDGVKGGKFILMDFHHLEFKPGEFDGFLAIASLLHVPKSKILTVLQSIQKILKPGGTGFACVKKKKDLNEGFIFQKELGVKRFFAFYNLAEFHNLAETAGFEVLKEYEKKLDNTYWLCFFLKKK